MATQRRVKRGQFSLESDFKGCVLCLKNRFRRRGQFEGHVADCFWPCADRPEVCDQAELDRRAGSERVKMV